MCLDEDSGLDPRSPFAIIKWILFFKYLNKNMIIHLSIPRCGFLANKFFTLDDTTTIKSTSNLDLFTLNYPEGCHR